MIPKYEHERRERNMSQNIVHAVQIINRNFVQALLVITRNFVQAAVQAMNMNIFQAGYVITRNFVQANIQVMTRNIFQAVQAVTYVSNINQYAKLKSSVTGKHDCISVELENFRALSISPN